MHTPDLDTSLVLWINGHNTPWLDSLMWTASRPATWCLLYIALLLIFFLLYRGGKNFRSWIPALAVVLAIAASAGLADLLSSGLLKPLIARPRPTHQPALEGLLHIVNGYTGGRYGCPSSHAADTMAVALSAILFARRATCLSPSGETTAHAANGPGKALTWILGIVLIVFYVLPNCYSRIYLGVHYPLDILFGLLIGAFCGWLCYWLTARLLDRINHPAQ